MLVVLATLCLITTDASGAWSDDWIFMGSETYGFVKNGRCEQYGMSRIFSVDQCASAASNLSETMEITGYNFADKTSYSLTDRPSGCSYHRFGNVEQFSGIKDDCDVRGFGGCFCDEADGSEDEEWTFMGSSTYGFVKNKKCEDYGMLSIDDVSDCQSAADSFGPTVGIKSDYKFYDRTDGSTKGRPVGCSWHRFGNVEQWGSQTTADCDDWGYGGCFCLVNFAESSSSNGFPVINPLDTVYTIQFSSISLCIVGVLVVLLVLNLLRGVCGRKKVRYAAVRVMSSDEEAMGRK